MKVIKKYPLYVFITLLIVNEQVDGIKNDPNVTPETAFTEMQSETPEFDNWVKTMQATVKDRMQHLDSQSTGIARTSGTTDTTKPPEKTPEEQHKESAIVFFKNLFGESLFKLETKFSYRINYQIKDHIVYPMPDDETWLQQVYIGYEKEEDKEIIFLSVGQIEGMYYSKMEICAPLAKKFTGQNYQLENRYFGAFFPVKDLSNANLLYLNSKQILADFMRFIEKNKFEKNNWIVCGEGYGGTLAAWFRLMFPNSVKGAVVYNAPLSLTAENKKYYDLLKNEFSDNVKNNIREAYKQMRAEITDDNYDSYKNKFNMCDKLDSQSNKDTNTDFMFWSLTTYLVEAVKLKHDQIQVNRAPYGDIIELLDHASIANPLDAFASAVVKILEHFKEPCLNVNFKTAFVGYKSTNKYDNEKSYPRQLKFGLGLRQTHWLHCNEFGMFNTSDGEHTFGEQITLEFHAKMCKESFDIAEFDSTTLDENVKKTNTVYGGQDIGASRLIYISRGDNPNVGITESPTDDRIAIHIEDGKQADQLQPEYDLIIRKLEEWTDFNTLKKSAPSSNRKAREASSSGNLGLQYSSSHGDPRVREIRYHRSSNDKQEKKKLRSSKHGRNDNTSPGKTEIVAQNYEY